VSSSPFSTVSSPDDASVATGTAGPAEAPPPLPADVALLLARHGATLPHYFDAQQAAAAARSHTDWPRIWRMAPPPP
jgi:hypothetical protein